MPAADHFSSMAGAEFGLHRFLCADALEGPDGGNKKRKPRCQDLKMSKGGHQIE